MANAVFEEIKDKYISTGADMQKNLIGYNILSKIFSDKEILTYTRSNIKVGSQYMSVSRATPVGTGDYCEGISKQEYV